MIKYKKFCFFFGLETIKKQSDESTLSLLNFYFRVARIIIRTMFLPNIIKVFLACQLLYNAVHSWNVVEEPLNFFDLTTKNHFNPENFIYEYSSNPDNYEQYRLLKHDHSNRYMILGARNRLIAITLNNKLRIDAKEYDISYETDDAEYILAMVPIEPTVTNLNNMLICKTGSICPRCIQSQFNEVKY